MTDSNRSSIAFDIDLAREIADLDERAQAPVGNALRAACDEIEFLREILQRIYDNERVWRVLPNSIAADMFVAMNKELLEDDGG